MRSLCPDTVLRIGFDTDNDGRLHDEETREIEYYVSDTGQESLTIDIGKY